MKTVVIAKYNENIDWVKELNDDIKVDIVQKGVDLEVFGREAASFFYYIVKNYDNLDGYYYFVQGNPFDHCKKLIRAHN